MVASTILGCAAFASPVEDERLDVLPPHAEEIDVLDCALDPGPESLQVWSLETGRIEVWHSGAFGACCPASIDVGVTPSAPTLFVDYLPAEDPCDCWCELDLRYVIEDVPPGTWMIVAGASRQAAKVRVR